MGLFDWFRTTQRNTAGTAKERLLIIVAQERAQRDSEDYLPTMKRELLEVIRKYIKVPESAVQVQLHRDGNEERLELTVSLPESKPL